MLTDDQLTDRLREAIAHHTADLEPAPDLLARVHGALEGLPAAEPRRRLWHSRPHPAALVYAAAATLAMVVAGLAIVLLGRGHHSHELGAAPAIVTGVTGVTGAPPRTPEARDLPPSAGRTRVAAPVHITVPDTSSRGQRAVRITVLARRAAGHGSWYAWTLTAPPACAGAGAGGPTRAPVAAGSRLTFDALLPAGCHGVVKASVVYVTAPARSNSETLTPVGHATARLP